MINKEDITVITITGTLYKHADCRDVSVSGNNDHQSVHLTLYFCMNEASDVAELQQLIHF